MNPVVEGYFQIVGEDLAAARLLAETVPRAAAFHLQQAAEKLSLAILAAENIHSGADCDIGQLVGLLADGHEWKEGLIKLEGLSRFALMFCSPGPGGEGRLRLRRPCWSVILRE